MAYNSAYVSDVQATLVTWLITLPTLVMDRDFSDMAYNSAYVSDVQRLMESDFSDMAYNSAYVSDVHGDFSDMAYNSAYVSDVQATLVTWLITLPTLVMDRGLL